MVMEKRFGFKLFLCLPRMSSEKLRFERIFKYLSSQYFCFSTKIVDRQR